MGWINIAPATIAGKIFTSLYILVGVGVFVILFMHLAKALLKIEADSD